MKNLILHPKISPITSRFNFMKIHVIAQTIDTSSNISRISNSFTQTACTSSETNTGTAQESTDSTIIHIEPNFWLTGARFGNFIINTNGYLILTAKIIATYFNNNFIVTS